VVDALALYGHIVAMWIRSTVVYRASFLMLTVSQFLVTGLDFVVIWIMFAHTNVLGGLDLPEVAFLYSTSGLALGIADLLIGSIDRLGVRIRDGSFDIFLIRPVSAFVQAAADQFALRRLGRITQSGAVFAWSLVALDIDWDWSRIVLLPLMGETSSRSIHRASSPVTWSGV
jgi:ABC-2 type transport system permease protein